MRPRKAKPEEAHGPPAGKRSVWNGNQRAYKLTSKKKKTQRELCFLGWIICYRFFLGIGRGS
ncbi:hypothetical protein FZC75_04175 [Sutcliffiella horikoshii]|uniref:Uncharacterized protein n=1 Tax=Sutcliffiella horikoshii TaxID=79883 RepID=A0A5D4THJ3_9BACI|nr:hypothetical protein FZC75_04175 [Sutcliffiella horikoshii]